VTDVEIQTVRAQHSSAYWSQMARDANWPLAKADIQNIAANHATLARGLYEFCLEHWLVLP
jgi:hypothetical protein